MSDLFDKTKIDKYINRIVPEHFPFINKSMNAYLYSLLNYSSITDELSNLESFFNIFENNTATNSYTIFDDRLIQFLNEPIQDILVLALQNQNVSLFQLFYSRYFDKFEMNYKNSQGYFSTGLDFTPTTTDVGDTTDEGNTTDTLPTGLYFMEVKVYYNYDNYDDVKEKKDIVVPLISVIKPAWIFFVFQPVLELDITDDDTRSHIDFLVENYEGLNNTTDVGLTTDASITFYTDTSIDDIVKSFQDVVWTDENSVTREEFIIPEYTKTGGTYELSWLLFCNSNLRYVKISGNYVLLEMNINDDNFISSTTIDGNMYIKIIVKLEF